MSRWARKAGRESGIRYGNLKMGNNGGLRASTPAEAGLGVMGGLFGDLSVKLANNLVWGYGTAHGQDSMYD